MVLGMASSGVHSNGFSLVRKVLEVSNVSLHDAAPWGGDRSAGAALLEPTVIYVKRVMALHEQVRWELLLGGVAAGLPHLCCFAQRCMWLPPSAVIAGSCNCAQLFSITPYP